MFYFSSKKILKPHYTVLIFNHSNREKFIDIQKKYDHPISLMQCPLVTDLNAIC